jgi:hypothetical protein
MQAYKILKVPNMWEMSVIQTFKMLTDVQKDADLEKFLNKVNSSVLHYHAQGKFSGKKVIALDLALLQNTVDMLS